MKMNDLSTLGKMYRGWSLGKEILTGLSRLRGGRCCGRRVCCFFAMFFTEIFLGMPGRYTLTGTLPTTVDVEKDRFGRGAGGAALAGCLVVDRLWPLALGMDADAGIGCSALSVLSCRSCAHGWSVNSGCIALLLTPVSSSVPDN